MPLSISILVPFLTVLALGAITIRFVVAFYEEKPGVLSQRMRHWAGSWDFTLPQLGGFGWLQLGLVSLFSLFLEMLMIRWISAEVPVFAYFKNFVLIACFLGFGLGCYFCRRTINLLAFIVPISCLVVLIKLPWPALRHLVQRLPFYIGPTSDMYLWGYSPLSSTSPVTYAAFAAAMALVVPFFALVAFSFVPIGQMVGWYLENASNGVWGYTVNVLSSLFGIALYTLLCFLFQPPPIWFAASGLMLVAVFWKIPRLRWISLAAALLWVGLGTIGAGGASRILWSPYQKVTLTPLPTAQNPTSYELQTNDSWHQEIIDLSPGFVATHPDYFRTVPVEWNAYNVPYRFFPNPPKVLVLGAGTGNDVAAALRNGAGSVTAVEIDPLILKLGREIHFEKPYDSPRVQTVVDDARSYIQNSPQQFDLIVFSLLDSHTTSSHFSNIRIDNYVYTKEALQAAKRLLKPDGVFIVKFWVETPWIAGRLFDLVQDVFGRPPLDLKAVQSNYTTAGRFFIAGSQERIQQALQDPVLRTYMPDDPLLRTQKVVPTTDDWPYLYQREPGLPLNIVVVSFLLIALCWVFLSRTGTRIASLRWHFFFLGAGFMLLEAQIVSKMALLFGTTWLVNSIVVGGLLLLIVAANVLVGFVPRIPYAVAWAGIFVSLAIAYLIPLEKLFFASVLLKALCATLVLCLPVFFAGIVFIRSFALAKFSGDSLGSNLFGALVGGLLESLSFWTGLKSLLIFAALLYAGAWIVQALAKGGESSLVSTTQRAA